VGYAAAVDASIVIIADDHPLFRAALVQTVAQLLPGSRLVEADSFDALNRAVAAQPQADLILLDLHMPGVRGFSSLIWLRGEHPAIPVAIVSAQEDPAVIRRALDFGASAFIPKSSGLDQIAAALRAVLDGQIWMPPQAADAAGSDEERELARRVAELTPQQFRVLMMLSDGRLNKQIAYDLGVTEATVKAHITAVLRKLGLYRRTQAALLAQQLLRADATAMRFETAEVAEPDPDS
jgi:DNA-binding NarL/FixJ family response regulator